jgi:hypothetical protein
VTELVNKLRAEQTNPAKVKKVDLQILVKEVTDPTKEVEAAEAAEEAAQDRLHNDE